MSNLSHTYPKDIDALLVSPTGIKTYLMAHCGSQISINNVTLTFDDSTNALLPYSTQIISGTYHPTSYALTPPQFPAPPAPFPTNATAPPYPTNLSVFNGSSPNGTWALYVLDDSFLNTGTIANGWILHLTVSGPVAGASDLALGMVSTPATVVASSNVTYTLTVTNFGPAGATNVTVLDPLPAGPPRASASPSTGSVTNSSGTVTWTISRPRQGRDGHPHPRGAGQCRRHRDQFSHRHQRVGRSQRRGQRRFRRHSDCLAHG